MAHVLGGNLLGLLPIVLVLAVIRFGSAMAVIEEYLIMGGFDKTRSTYTWTVYMYDTAFGGGMQFPAMLRRSAGSAPSSC